MVPCTTPGVVLWEQSGVEFDFALVRFELPLKVVSIRQGGNVFGINTECRRHEHRDNIYS